MTRAAWLVLLQFTGIACVAFLGPFPPSWVLAVLVAALGLVGWSVKAMGTSSFTVSPLPREGAQFTRVGPYRWVRHPMYLAVLLCALAFVLGAWSVWRGLAAVVLVAVLVVKIRVEERALGERYPGYAEAMANVPRLVPFLW